LACRPYRSTLQFHRIAVIFSLERVQRAMVRPAQPRPMLHLDVVRLAVCVRVRQPLPSVALIESGMGFSNGVRMFGSPGAEGCERLIECSAQGRHHILDAGRCVVDESSVDDAVALQPAQTLGQGLLCNTGYPPPKVVKAQRATSRSNRPQDEDAPAIGDLIEQEAIEIIAIGFHQIEAGS
jgi:hypothetical protein